MNSFDAAAASDAYLHQIPAAREALATAYTRGGHWLLLWSKVVAAAAACVVGRLRRPGASDMRKGAALTGFAAIQECTVVLFLYFCLELPWFAFADWWRERLYGFSSQTLGSWLVGYVAQSVLTACVGAVLFAGFYAMSRRAGAGWWIWGSGLATIAMVLALVVQPVLLSPLLNRYTPAPAGATTGAMAGLLAAAGIPGARIVTYHPPDGDPRYKATVTGWGAEPTVLLSAAMLDAGAGTAEVKAVVAHEIGHERRRHPLLLALALAAIVSVGLVIAQASFGPVARAMGRPGAVITEVAGLPVLLAIFAGYSLATTPLVNSAERYVEADADRYGLELAREPDGMARAVVATADFRASSPSGLEEALFYDHPSVRRRLEVAMRWKADRVASGPEGRER